MHLDIVVQLNILGIIIMCTLAFSLRLISSESISRKYYNYLFNLVFIMLSLDTISFLLSYVSNPILIIVDYIIISIVQAANIVPVIIWVLLILDEFNIPVRITQNIRRGMFGFFILNIILVLSNPMTNWIIIQTLDNIYSRGPLYFLYPVFNSVFGFAGLYLIIKKGRIYENQKHMNYLVALLIMGVGGIVHTFVPFYASYWMAISIALIFIYSGILGNISSIDPNTGLYKFRYQKSIVGDYREYDIPYVLIQFTPFESDPLDTFSFNEFAKKITSTYNDLGIFSANNNAIILLSRSSNVRTLTRYIQDKREYEEEFIYGILEVDGEKKHLK